MERRSSSAPPLDGCYVDQMVTALSDAQARFTEPILLHSEPRVTAFSPCSGSSYH